MKSLVRRSAFSRFGQNFAWEYKDNDHRKDAPYYFKTYSKPFHMDHRKVLIYKIFPSRRDCEIQR